MGKDTVTDAIHIEERADGIYITIDEDKEIGYSEVTRYVKSLNAQDIDYSTLKQAFTISRGKSVRVGMGTGGADDISTAPLTDISVEKDDEGRGAHVTLSKGCADIDLTYRDIIKALKYQGVTRGYLSKNIKSLAKKKPMDERVKVAEWTPPMHGMDAEITYHVPEYQDLLPFLLKAGPDAPFEDINFIRGVKKGDVIMTRVPPVNGVPGSTVTGEKVPCNEGKDFPLETSKYLSVSPDETKAVAAIDGQVVVDHDGGVVIRPLMALKKTSGDREIKFDGSVVVEGDLSYCPGIRATGDIEINGGNQNVPLIARNIFIKGTHLLYGGRKGRALRDFACAITNNTHITARNIYLDKVASQSILEAEEEVHANLEHGKIVGGEIQAGEKVVVGELGNKKEIETLVRVATAEIQNKYNDKNKKETEKKLDRAKEIFDQADEEYMKLDQERKALVGDPMPADLEQRVRLAKEKKKASQAELDAFKTDLVRRKSFKPDFNKGEVVCRFVHSGVKLEMGHSVRQIKIPIDAPVRFLKRKAGIVTEMK